MRKPTKSRNGKKAAILRRMEIALRETFAGADVRPSVVASSAPADPEVDRAVLRWISAAARAQAQNYTDINVIFSVAAKAALNLTNISNEFVP